VSTFIPVLLIGLLLHRLIYDVMFCCFACFKLATERTEILC